MTTTSNATMTSNATASSGLDLERDHDPDLDFDPTLDPDLLSLVLDLRLKRFRTLRHDAVAGA
jgi:hypothetical protein